jgi:hypothetical protein
MPETLPAARPTRTPKALREDRAKIAAEIRRMADDGTAADADGNFTPGWVQANADYDALTRQITSTEAVAKRLDDMKAEDEARAGAVRAVGGFRSFGDGRATGGDGAETAATEEQRAMALQAWCRVQMDEDPTEEQLAACHVVGLNPSRRKLQFRTYRTQDVRALQKRFRTYHPALAGEKAEDYKATLSQQAAASGGYLVPPESLVRSLEINMLAFGGMRQVAETIRTASGERMSWPTADDTTNTGAQLGENTSIGSSTDPAFAKGLLGRLQVQFEAGARALRAARGLRLRPGHHARPDARRAARPHHQHQVHQRLGGGDRQGRHHGGGDLRRGVGDGDHLRRHPRAHPLDRPGLPDRRRRVHAARPDPAQAAAAEGRPSAGYLWESNIAVGVPDRLAGYQLTNNQDMDSTVASGKKTLLFGRLSNYKIRSVGITRMYRLQERYRDTDQDGFVAFIREDGNLLTAGTAPVKVLTH